MYCTSNLESGRQTALPSLRGYRCYANADLTKFPVCHAQSRLSLLHVLIPSHPASSPLYGISANVAKAAISIQLLSTLLDIHSHQNGRSSYVHPLEIRPVLMM